MKDYSTEAKRFYHSRQWKKTRKLYLMSKNYICERCGAPAELVHHKKAIDKNGINDPDILLNWDNLEALCQNCHNKEHFGKSRRNITFDDEGNPIF